MRDWFNRWRPIWLACFVAGYVLTALVRLAAGSDYTVTRGTVIASERPIGILVLQAGLGVVNGDGLRLDSLRGRLGGQIAGSNLASRLSVDGEAASPHGVSARAAWRLVGFLLWDAEGSIERTTTATVRGHAVRISDRVENGKVVVRVVVGPPLGDPHVRCAVLELEVNEDVEPTIRQRIDGGTRIQLSCSAVLDLPGDRCCLVRRVARRIAEREAGPELAIRCAWLGNAGREAVLSGRGRLNEIVAEFLERVCR